MMQMNQQPNKQRIVIQNDTELGTQQNQVQFNIISQTKENETKEVNSAQRLSSSTRALFLHFFICIQRHVSPYLGESIREKLKRRRKHRGQTGFWLTNKPFGGHLRVQLSPTLGGGDLWVAESQFGFVGLCGCVAAGSRLTKLKS